MFPRIALAVLVAVLLYAAYSYVTVRKENFVNYKLEEQSFEHAAPEEPPEVYAPREIAPGGPSAPVLRSARPAVVVADEQPRDPSASPYESSAIPEQLRHPERMFGPGVKGESMEIAEQSGIASSAQQQVSRAFTVFSPEFAQNGGSFMEGGITAFDSDVPNSYSMLD